MLNGSPILALVKISVFGLKLYQVLGTSFYIFMFMEPLIVYRFHDAQTAEMLKTAFFSSFKALPSVFDVYFSSQSHF
ncbi:hypothetical protein CEXT_112811 [Caerostris extrusa]|uniref:Uncharacterized protein n=1 Tax=Caerostris extrusa TaxID=172846 RepID=A0AAV4QLX2_CAEEX|nr:hypothetical protein CEXT_112811 [Caerostris extrusa]